MPEYSGVDDSGSSGGWCCETEAHTLVNEGLEVGGRR